MNAAMRPRIASCALLLLSCLPAAAQNVRYEMFGQAYVMDLTLSRIESSVLRNVIGIPPADRGQVVFYRPNRAGDPVEAVAVQEQGATVGTVPGDSYIVTAATPGPHAYRLDAGSNEVAFDVKPGRTYFVRIGTTRDTGRLVRSDAVGMIDAARGRHEPLY
jgi:hypothetical protein